MNAIDAAKAPRVVASADDVDWDETAEVVVVGFGGAGVAAAIQARELGASVIAIDRFQGGGATGVSGGVVYAGGTRYQRESGFDDTAEEMYKYLDVEGATGAVSPATLKRFCEGSSGDIDWLDRHGVPHGSNAFLEKTTFPPDPHWLYYSGNEMMPNYAAKAKTAPRGHRTVAPGFLDGGKVLYAHFSQSALAMDVKLLRHSPVTRLVMDAQNRIIGVEVNALPQSLWEKHLALYRIVQPYRPFNGDRSEQAISAARELEQSVTNPRRIRATGGVVLATGGFIYNLPKLSEHRPGLAKHYRELLRLGCLADDGSGIELGQSVGGITSSMDHVSVARAVAPPNVFAHGVMVNTEGRRFVNEAAYAVNVGNAILDQPDDGKAWLILDAHDFWTGVKKSFFPGKSMFLAWGAPALMNIFLGGTRRAGTLEGLAKKIGANAANLVAEMRHYNAMAKAGTPDPLGKLQDLMHVMGDEQGRGPFYAVNMSISNRFCPAMAFTVGGLVLEEVSGKLKRGDGSVIEGLYGAGRVAVGIPSNGYVSGLCIADAIFSGRRAARSIAASLSRPAG